MLGALDTCLCLLLAEELAAFREEWAGKYLHQCLLDLQAGHIVMQAGRNQLDFVCADGCSVDVIELRLKVELSRLKPRSGKQREDYLNHLMLETVVSQPALCVDVWGYGG